MKALPRIELTYNGASIVLRGDSIQISGDPVDVAMAIANRYFDRPPIQTATYRCLEISHVDDKYSLWVRQGSKVPPEWPEVVAAFDRICALRAFL